METDPYYLANEKLINDAWLEHYSKQTKENKTENLDEYLWGGGVFDAPPF